MERSFWLPLPPSVNQLYPGKVRRHKSDEYYAWELKAALAMREQHLDPFVHQTTTHRWRVKVECYMLSWRADMDNTVKAGIDFIAGWFRLDDRYLVELHMLREETKKAPRWQVELTIEGA